MTQKWSVLVNQSHLVNCISKHTTAQSCSALRSYQKLLWCMRTSEITAILMSSIFIWDHRCSLISLLLLGKRTYCYSTLLASLPHSWHWITHNVAQDGVPISFLCLQVDQLDTQCASSIFIWDHRCSLISLLLLGKRTYCYSTLLASLPHSWHWITHNVAQDGVPISFLCLQVDQLDTQCAFTRFDSFSCLRKCVDNCNEHLT